MTSHASPSATIRSACHTDADRVYEFLCDLEGVMLNSRYFRDIFGQNVADPTIHYLVAECSDTVVGFVSCHVQHLLHHTGKVGEIQELYVHPDYRNQRIGRQLIAALNALAVQENMVNLEVTTRRSRTDAILFYEREQFHQTHVKLTKPV